MKALMLALVVPTVMFGVPRLSEAQTTSFPEVTRFVRAGDAVSVTDATGQRIHGKVAELTASSLTLLIDEQQRTIPEGSVRSIVVKDSLKNGMLIGLALGGVAGFISGAALGNVAATHCPTGQCGEYAKDSGLRLGFVGAVIGTGIGVLIDKAIHKTVFTRGPAAVLTVSPAIGARRQGLLVSIRF